jgi:hypothetical protein
VSDISGRADVRFTPKSGQNGAFGAGSQREKAVAAREAEAESMMAKAKAVDAAVQRQKAAWDAAATVRVS